MTAEQIKVGLVMIAFAQPSVSGLPDTEVVARIGQHTITRRQIACEATANTDPSVPPNAGDRDALCLEQEQRRLDIRITEELHAAAIRKLNIVVSQEEMDQDAAVHRYGDAEFARLAEHYRNLAHAAVLVYRGEDLHAVYMRDVATRGGQSEEQFRHFVTVLRSADGAERFMEYQTAEHFRDQITADSRQRVARDKLMRYLYEAAAKSNMTLDSYSEAFWSSLVTDVGVEIADPRYKLLSLKGLSWQTDQRSR